MKNYIKLILCFCLLPVLITTRLQAQGTTVANGLQSSFKQYSLNSLQEKAFVHTDKNTYTVGELIWFKVYYVNGMFNQPLNLSKVVYVEVLDKNQNAVLQAKIALNNGAGSGSFYVPLTLATGNFVLRAYTSWMKNFSPDYYFRKAITVINPLKSPEAIVKTAIPGYDIQFFPEGGNLVANLTSVVGFKATDKTGKGINFKGAILNSKNDTIVKFEPLKFGLGHFTFKPDVNTNYHASIKIGVNTIQKDLPVVSANGCVMSLKDNASAALQVTVSSSNVTGPVYLFAHTRNQIKIVESSSITDGKAIFSIDKNKLGDGISHLTIFNDSRQPVCERLYFKRPASNLLIMAVPDQQEYATRKKVSVDFGAKNQNDIPTAADLSLSVYRLDSLESMSHEDIRNYLWLSSDLRGDIESPDYYFKNDNAESDEAIDNLMLTQGWRRFDWSEVLKNKPPAFNFLAEYNGPVITAKLSAGPATKPVKDVITYLAIPGKSVQVYTAAADSAGHLLFNMNNFYGPGEIVLQTNPNIDSNFHIDVLNPFSEQYTAASLPGFDVTPGMHSAFEERSLDMQVQNYYSGTKLRQFYDPAIDSAGFFGHPDQSYLLDNYVRFATIEEVLREYVHQVLVFNPKNHFHIKVQNEYELMSDDPLVLIDGVPFFNIDKVFAANPLKLRKLDVVPYLYYWGPSVSNGILSFTSYKGDMGGNEIDPNAVIMDYEGLELQRQFYSPVYDNDNTSASRIPDFRNVLYWAPYLTTNARGKNSLSFYTSDQTGTFIGVIQGITANGEAGSQYFKFTVKK